MADQLTFDGSGQLLTESLVGPITLSGVDVETVTLKGKALVITGVRVALVAKAAPGRGLERRRISFTTKILFSMRPRNQRDFHALEEMRLTVRPDPQGRFDAAIAKIFADGLPELALSVPPYWQCYASSYFKAAAPAEDAEQATDKCVVSSAELQEDVAAQAADGQTVAPVMLSSASPRLPVDAYELRASGTSVIHLRIREDGVPVGLQVVRAIGAGVDESVLEAVAKDRFHPGTRNGRPVPANMDLTFNLPAEQAR